MQVVYEYRISDAGNLADRYRRALCASFPLRHVLFLMCIQKCYGDNVDDRSSVSQYYYNDDYLRTFHPTLRIRPASDNSRMPIRIKYDCT